MSGAVQRALAACLRELPPELAEVLALAMQATLHGERLVVTLPNPIWREVVERYAAPALQRAALAEGWQCTVIVVDDVAASGEHAFADWCEDPGNRLALAACRAVLREPGVVHNPLYLHGPPGCGKSHLLAALARSLAEAAGSEQVLAFGGAEFVARASGAGTLGDPWAERWQRALLIVCDDIEALCGHPVAQERFFVLLDQALERGQQVAVAARLPPRQLPEMEERLVSRLAWGLVVEIEPPQLETRLALLRRLSARAAAMEGRQLAELVQAWAPDMRAVRELAERLERGERPARAGASFDRILQAVAERFGVRPGDIVGPRRSRRIALARQAALLLARRCTDHSLVALGGLVGGRDHATVLYGIRQAEARAAADPEFARVLAELTRALTAATPNS
ncbi:MAG: DnaA/Hda family protein [Planctomycetes bacterium]|nr:DnaA/Hda family protein [Planctomycetota bacterium]